jgi:glycine cleavage system H protein
MVHRSAHLLWLRALHTARAHSRPASVDKLHTTENVRRATRVARLTRNTLRAIVLAAHDIRARAHGTLLVIIDEQIRDTRRLAMTVILMLLTLTIFLTIDYLMSRRKAAAHVEEAALDLVPAHVPAEPVWVGGYQLPEDLRYHPGHTWVRALSPDTAAIGIDDFARRLLGRAKSVTVPEPGSRLTAGRPTFHVHTETGGANLVAPLSGEVTDVNPQLEAHPDLATDEPYGRGWLCNIKSHDLAAGLRNLLGGSMARRWTEDSRERLGMQLVALSGSVLQDGGEPVADFARHLPVDDWKRLTREFFLN